MKDIRRELRRGLEAESEIDDELERRKSLILDSLIDEFLLAQRGQELGFDADEQLKRLEKIYADPFPISDELRRRSYLDWEQIRASTRRQILGQVAIQKEVLEPIFQRITDKERREYYDRHKDRVFLPETVTLSEVFLSLDGKSESEIAQRAIEVLAELRDGAEFAKAVEENTPSNAIHFLEADPSVLSESTNSAPALHPILRN